MKEEVRLKAIDDYQREKQKLEKEIKYFEELSKTPEVREFLKTVWSLFKKSERAEGIHSNVDDVYCDFSIIPSQLMETVCYPHYFTCEHDTLLLAQANIFGNTFYCLDCGVTFKTNDSKYLEKRNVYSINSKDASLSSIRNKYFELLPNHTSEEAVSILKRKLEI